MLAEHPGRTRPEPADDYERRYGRLGGRETRAIPITVEEIRDSGAEIGRASCRERVYVLV